MLSSQECTLKVIFDLLQYQYNVKYLDGEALLSILYNWKGHDKRTVSEDSLNEKAVSWLKYINAETQHATHAHTQTHI